MGFVSNALAMFLSAIKKAAKNTSFHRLTSFFLPKEGMRAPTPGNNRIVILLAKLPKKSYLKSDNFSKFFT